MDFALTRAQQETQERAREAVGRVVVPLAKALRPGERLSAAAMSQLYKGLAPLGYLGSTISPELGGAGMSLLDYGLLLEALGSSPVVLAEIVPPRLIAAVGTPEQRKRWLGPLLAGDWISTAAITEPQAGSDTRAFACEGIAEQDGYRVTGRKKWIKLGGIADLITLMVVEPGREPKARHTRLVVERSVSPWRSRELPSVGIRNLSYAELEFDHVLVPRENLLGQPGQALAAFGRGIEASRPFIGLTAVGIANAAFDVARAYAGERVAFGRPLAKFQAIQLALADAATELAAARLLCLQALWIMDQGRACAREASMAKVYATEAAVRVCHAAMDVMGAMGLSEGAPVERCWRDCRMLTVIDGTSDIQRLIIGRELTGHSAFI
ncbi:MAG TPA: acyl-CoA dehydrogenase family protein [Alphaproteobacteria bacterium]|nr:acyl-CoA dehydrogenase family protein [Alphaproteobacteria bacterium]